jgi:hypothetical protein
MSIPISTIISVVPAVLASGGNPLALNGLLLSQNPVLPVGAPVSFPTLASVQAYFGQYNASILATCVANTLTITQTLSGTIAVGQELQSLGAVGVPPGTYITALGTYSTGTGIGTVTISGPGFTQATASAMTSNCLESQMAAVYFNGYTGSTVKPTALLFGRYASYAIPAFFRGTSMPSLTLAQLQAITSGTLTVTINGTLVSIAALNLSSASSFSNAASLIQTAFAFSGGTAGSTVTWSSAFNAFVITSGTTGAGSTITVCGGTNATTLGLGVGTLSQGSAANVPGTFMTALAVFTSNWATFSTCFEPVIADKQAFATWNAGTGGQFVYVPYDSDPTIVSSNASTTCISYYTKLNSLGGTCAVYQDPNAAAFVLGFVASINFNAKNGRAAIAYKSGTGITPTVNDPVSSANAIANGTNFYGNWATANASNQFFWNGQLSGAFGWLDSYVNAIWLNSSLQLALVNMFTNLNAIPYNPQGYSMIKAAALGPITAALNAGVINTGVVLTALQIANVNSAAGLTIDPALANNGYYLQVLPASANQRNNRLSPPCTLWWMDGGSVNQLNLASISIQ